ncbi:glycoside hydrolase family 5 protein [Vibrio cincinnatiensis]|uniref:glycoside hydrolase family 5 protein n=1 Tax=Vibrio cincinnatiensis TaxID=675 RepID=UPI001EDDEA63|nr:glycoside hydrolase family 5 protein [Vibrio cincinnatiensis]MCG3733589.1 glycoside hydrolase family 5 protein [Vibrio cincinnatiensis]MCG3739418.1 glycoside hydrolase family 5 protein [Vibrio cincinnatiensis]
MLFSKVFSLCVVILTLILTMGCGSGGSENKGIITLDSQYYKDIYQWNMSKGLSFSLLGRGINMGNFLESPNYEGEWNNGLTIQASDFKNISQSGFASVRIPVRWNAHTLLTDPYTIEEAFMARVQEVVDQAIQEGLKVIINAHHFDELFYDNKNFEFHRSRLLAFWDQISKRFPLNQYDEDQLIFEFLNEPHDTVTVIEWNHLIAELTERLWIINANTQNNILGQRKVMIGTADWGGPSKLPQLALPSSSNVKNTIITVHFYEPFTFTHQGASWVDGAKAWIGTRWIGSEPDQQVLFDYLDSVEAWNTQIGHGFEINIGEFGVFSQHSKPEDQRAWTAFIAREAEKRGFSWHYWEYSSGFGAYDPYSEKWRISLLEGLIPESTDH